VQSRRLGRSLGINLLPAEYKLCSFNCLYCQYGWTKNVTFTPGDRLQDLPSPDVVASALETALAEFSRGHKTIDAISICGNGEPTLYPALAEVIIEIKKLRDSYQPDARTAILSNSSTVGDPAVRVALELLDLKIMKFDAGSEEMFRQLNHPGRAGLHGRNCFRAERTQEYVGLFRAGAGQQRRSGFSRDVARETPGNLSAGEFKSTRWIVSPLIRESKKSVRPLSVGSLTRCARAPGLKWKYFDGWLIHH
jgi:hypothetical protein